MLLNLQHQGLQFNVSRVALVTNSGSKDLFTNLDPSQNAPTRNQILMPEDRGVWKGKLIAVLKVVVSVNASTLMQPFSWKWIHTMQVVLETRTFVLLQVGSRLSISIFYISQLIFPKSRPAKMMCMQRRRQIYLNYFFWRNILELKLADDPLIKKFSFIPKSKRFRTLLRDWVSQVLSN